MVQVYFSDGSSSPPCFSYLIHGVIFNARNGLDEVPSIEVSEVCAKAGLKVSQLWHNSRSRREASRASCPAADVSALVPNVTCAVNIVFLYSLSYANVDKA